MDASGVYIEIGAWDFPWENTNPGGFVFSLRKSLASYFYYICLCYTELLMVLLFVVAVIDDGDKERQFHPLLRIQDP